MRKITISVIAACSALIFATPVLAAPKTYPDGHGGVVTFSEGDVSFADEVVHYDTGSKAPIEYARDPRQALGVPAHKSGDKNFTSLGCGGEIILKFTDNILIDVPGPDLYVFEIGPAVEPTALAISNDGENWTRIGRIEGGKAEIDIAPYVRHGDEFRYVRLIDLQADCRGDTPGADIDAVGAIGSAERISLDSSVLFTTDKYELEPTASKAIRQALEGIDPSELQSAVVAGHTDNVGNAEYNQELSENRANAVARFLIDHASFDAERLATEAWGLTRPIASNETTEGRAQNRRVEITLRRSASFVDEQAEPIEIYGLWKASELGIIELRSENGVELGEYTNDNGRIHGAFIRETVFEGYWIEDDSRERCDSEKAGSHHWGRLRLEFDTVDLNTFIGQWAYCDGAEWLGNWPKAKRLL